MSERRLMFTEETTFLGRNGSFRQAGLAVSLGDHDLVLEPVTSKVQVGRCELRIPKQDLPDFMLAINQLVMGIESQPDGQD